MKAIALLSGGIDSPVAIHLMQRKGLEIVAVHFSYYPLTDKTTEEKCKTLAKKLGITKLYIIPFAQPQTEVVQHCDHALFYVITKRLMIKMATEIAKKEGAQALITGENLGQVSSQTLHNLSVISAATDLPILRPLLTKDKQVSGEIALTEPLRNKELMNLSD